eukprot:CAMPEP_0184701586 /NCGR_PEP_ID=MMETSP0313-20130426/20545_1 /TAXON_ID=2792 /ORGANISM="Porphyridium aerugineum, Strain SAG 1380-2" /LENGTH=381 /DNA_ID=CAMNT_0027161695 /DNA_START=58 /DNA_END=1203 /DNA_ORIENTATION=-
MGKDGSNNAMYTNPDEFTKTGKVDVTMAGRKVYIVKFPNFLLENLEERARAAMSNSGGNVPGLNPNPIVGKLRLPIQMDDDVENTTKGLVTLTDSRTMQANGASKRSDGKPPVSGGSSSNLNKSSTLGDAAGGSGNSQLPKIPTQYDLRFLPEAPSTLIFSEDPADDHGVMRCEGRVAYHCVAQPHVNEAYLEINRARFENANKRGREVAFLDDKALRDAQVDELRPLAFLGVTPKDKEEKRRKQELLKRVSDTPMDDKWRDNTITKLFGLFERHSYWSLRSLLDETNESAQRLKPLVSELCVYNKRGPYMSMYELKDEFKTTQQRTDKEIDARDRRKAQMEMLRDKLRKERDAVAQEKTTRKGGGGGGSGRNDEDDDRND